MCVMNAAGAGAGGGAVVGGAVETGSNMALGGESDQSTVGHGAICWPITVFAVAAEEEATVGEDDDGGGGGGGQRACAGSKGRRGALLLLLPPPLSLGGLSIARTRSLTLTPMGLSRFLTRGRAGGAGVACRSRWLISCARSFVAASKTDMTPGKKTIRIGG